MRIEYFSLKNKTIRNSIVERERDRQTETDRQRQTDTDRQNERERGIEREMEREKEIIHKLITKAYRRFQFE